MKYEFRVSGHPKPEDAAVCLLTAPLTDAHWKRCRVLTEGLTAEGYRQELTVLASARPRDTSAYREFLWDHAGILGKNFYMAWCLTDQQINYVLDAFEEFEIMDIMNSVVEERYH